MHHISPWRETQAPARIHHACTIPVWTWSDIPRDDKKIIIFFHGMPCCVNHVRIDEKHVRAVEYMRLIHDLKQSSTTVTLPSEFTTWLLNDECEMYSQIRIG